MIDLTDREATPLEPAELRKLVAYAQACGVANVHGFVEDALRTGSRRT